MRKPLSECRVTVVGLGLMGASLCLDLTQKNLCREVRGVAHRTETVLQAFFTGAVHTYAERLDDAAEAYGEAREHFAATGARTGEVSCRIALAAVRIRQQRYHEARHALETLLREASLHTYQRRGVHLALLACVAPDPDDARWREHLGQVGAADWAEVANVELLELAGERALAAGYVDRARQAWGKAIPLWEHHDPRRGARLRERSAELR